MRKRNRGQGAARDPEGIGNPTNTVDAVTPRRSTYSGKRTGNGPDSSPGPSGVIKNVIGGPHNFMPVVGKRDTYTGSSAYTAVTQDNDFPRQPQVITIPALRGSTNWSFTTQPGHFPPVDAFVASTMYVLYGKIITAVQQQKKNQWRNPALLDPTRIKSWLNIYTNAFLTIRCLENLVNAPFGNRTLEFAALAANALPVNAINSASRSLRLTPISSEIVSLLDCLCGIKMVSERETVFVYGLNELVPDQCVDITSQDDLFGLAIQAESDLRSLTNQADGPTQTDFQRIWDLFSVAYGYPTIGPKSTTQSYAEWQAYMNAAVAKRVTDAELFTYPTMSETVTLLQPQFHINSDSEETKQALSLLGWTSYFVGVSPVVGVGNLIGLLSNITVADSTYNTIWGAHDNSGTFVSNNLSLFTPGADPLTTGIDINRFILEAQEQVIDGSQFSIDGRMWPNLVQYKIPAGLIVDATQFKVLDVFLRVNARL